MHKSMRKAHEQPWKEGDPTRNTSLNIPFPEPLMQKLDYLKAHKRISSKSSFIREAVEAAAIKEIEELWRIDDALRFSKANDRRRNSAARS